jgi:type VI secretion system protein ImpG
VRDDLLAYYERELTFLRQMGAEFAGRYPKAASQLQLEPNRCEDPHVERMIEASALLAARIHLRLDDDFPEITQGLFNIIYPHYLRPVPSMTVAEFQLREGMTSPQRIGRNAMMYSRQVSGVSCRFRTCFDTDVWPLRITEAQWLPLDRLDPPLKSTGAASVVRIRVDCWPDVQFDRLPLSALRLYLNGELPLSHTLYELLCNNCRSIVLRNPRPRVRQRPIELFPSALRPVGFAEDESVLPYSSRSFDGYRILQEYFAFPEKFFFFDLQGMDVLQAAKFQDSVEILFLLSPHARSEREEMLALGVGPRTLRLNCSPIVNLFPHAAEPIQMDQTKYEYPVTPDYRHGRPVEIFSIDDVVCSFEKSRETVRVEPFFSFRHATSQKTAAFWSASRRKGGAGEQGGGTVYITVSDLNGRFLQLDLDTLSLRCTCSNGDLPARLPFGDDQGDLVLEEGAAVGRISALRKPSAMIYPALGRETLWRLVSHLALNYLSLVEGGREALQEVLRLYQSPHTADHQIDGIAAVTSERRFARVVGEQGISYVRGVRVLMELDEEKFVGGGVYLFASVVEHFLAQYVSMNSFSQLAVRTRQRKELLREWEPRTGNRILL